MEDWWIKELYLYESDRQTLFADVELSDAVINASQSLLKAQYPSFGGFQNTCFSQGLKFQPISRKKKSVQILNTGEQYQCLQTIHVDHNLAVALSNHKPK